MSWVRCVPHGALGIHSQQQQIHAVSNTGNQIAGSVYKVVIDGIGTSTQEEKWPGWKPTSQPTPHAQSQTVQCGAYPGKMNIARWAVLLAPLFYCHLQRDLARTLEARAQNYIILLTLLEMVDRSSVQLEREVACHLRSLSRLILTLPSSNCMVCCGQRNRGLCFRQEYQLHVNCLELLPAIIAIQPDIHEIPTKTINYSNGWQCNSYGIYQCPWWDIISHVNCLNEISLAVHLIGCPILLKAQRLPGKLNHIVNSKSWQMRDRRDWQLNPKVYIQINTVLHVGPLETDRPKYCICLMIDSIYVASPILQLAPRHTTSKIHE